MKIVLSAIASVACIETGPSCDRDAEERRSMRLESIVRGIHERQTNTHYGVEKILWRIKRVEVELTWLALPHGC